MRINKDVQIALCFAGWFLVVISMPFLGLTQDSIEKFGVASFIVLIGLCFVNPIRKRIKKKVSYHEV